VFGKVISAHAMKANGGVDAEFNAFLNLALHGDERSVSHTGHFTFILISLIQDVLTFAALVSSFSIPFDHF
jgi:hypothetical protein